MAQNLVPLDIPPGVFQNGTGLQARGRWRDANLVRWVEGALQPIRGWRRRQVDGVDMQVSGVGRAALLWHTNAGAVMMAIGTSDVVAPGDPPMSHLYVIENATDIQEVTPGDLTSGYADASVFDGYGMGDYGEDDYGTPRDMSDDDASYANYRPASMWTLGNWGENLIAHLPEDRRIFEVPPGGAATQIAGSPLASAGFIVTNERILMALGCDDNPRLIKWSAQENNTDWVATDLNQAGDRELPTNGTIITGRATPDGVIIWTTEDVWIGRYIGPPYVYGFTALAGKCSLASRQAIAVIDSRVVWMGNNGFWMYDSVLQPLQCDVGDFLFKHTNTPQMSKAWATVNHGMNEVVFFYPSEESNEVNRYVAWNYHDGWWGVGKFARTCGVPAGLAGPYPILVTPDGFLYNHGVGFDYEGADPPMPFIESWPMELGEGDRQMMVQSLVPDELQLGDVEVTFKTSHYPTFDPTKPLDQQGIKTYGPYTLANPTNPRLAAREVIVRFDGVNPTEWRIGRMRLGLRPMGSR